jgi:branched-chain amino acid transport system ATP-binding protein
MSGGEQQMLAMGRALMAKPKLLLLDEPSMGLAPKLIAQIFEIISEINKQGTTVLLVEQNAAQALKRAHRAYILETGEIVRQGTGAELASDDAVKAAYLGGDVSRGTATGWVSRGAATSSAGRRRAGSAGERRPARAAGRRPVSP